MLSLGQQLMYFASWLGNARQDTGAPSTQCKNNVLLPLSLQTCSNMPVKPLISRVTHFCFLFWQLGVQEFLLFTDPYLGVGERADMWKGPLGAKPAAAHKVTTKVATQDIEHMGS